MALMTDNQRKAVWAGIMERLSSRHEALGTMTKADVRAAIDAADQWISDNQASFKTALPAAFAANATNAQKIELFMLIADGRHGAGV